MLGLVTVTELLHCFSYCTIGVIWKCYVFSTTELVNVNTITKIHYDIYRINKSVDRHLKMSVDMLIINTQVNDSVN